MSLPPSLMASIQARIGTTVRKKYTLDALLGAGGMGSVFAATHRNGSRVALKILHPELAKIADMRSRFLREGYVANKIGHPGVVQVVDDDDDDENDTVFLVLELLSGETVASRAFRLGGKLPVPSVLEVGEQTLDVLVAAHAQGIVHRDIKPENLFFTQAGVVKVLDFGIARLLDGTGATLTGLTLGTPAYMSPEQANGRTKEVDGQSDVWATGAVMFSLLAGRPVHVGTSTAAQLVGAGTDRAPLIASLTSGVPPHLAAVIDRALAFEKPDRWASAETMRGALRAVRKTM